MSNNAKCSILPLRLDAVSCAINGSLLVDAVSARIEAGRRTIVLGPNGAGKSLLMRLCHGLLQPTTGAIIWENGQQLSPAALRRRQAMVFQRPVVLRRSVIGNVVYALSLARFPRAGRVARAQASLSQFGLLDLAQRAARELSGGEQQRLALARAWAIEPEIVFLDEPTASLDPAATRAVEAAVGLFHAAGAKVIMSTHDLGQARRLADEVMFLCKGRLMEHTPAAEFFSQPHSAEARAFLNGDLVW